MTPNYDRAAKMAYRSILSLGINTLPIDPLMILKRCKNTAVHTYDEIMPLCRVSDPSYFKAFIMEGKDAVTIRREIGGRAVYELFYDAQANRRRMRFTLAHELGHIVLGHHQEQPWEEKEADYFASQLLAPRPVFNVLALRGLDTSDPEFIARTFYLSKAAAEIAARVPIHQPDGILYKSVASQFAGFAESIAV